MELRRQPDSMQRGLQTDKEEEKRLPCLPPPLNSNVCINSTVFIRGMTSDEGTQFPSCLAIMHA